MKYILTEQQVRRIITEGRIDTLKSKFNVMDEDELMKFMKTPRATIIKNGESIYAVVATERVKPKQTKDGEEPKEKEIPQSKIAIAEKVFLQLVESDPSKNKEFLQWMLQKFIDEIKSHPKDAFRFVSEDIPQLESALNLFSVIKKRKGSTPEGREDFLNTLKNKGVNHPSNPFDINQYKAVTDLVATMQPFMGGAGGGQLRTALDIYEANGEIKVWIDTADYMMWSPINSLKAATLEMLDGKCALNRDTGGLTTWCTAGPGNGMYKTYTASKGKQLPDGKDSFLFVIAEKALMDNIDDLKPSGVNGNLFQIHFESDFQSKEPNGQGQVKDANNSSVLFKDVMGKYPKIKQFFAKKFLPYYSKLESKRGTEIKKNRYLMKMLTIGGDSTVVFDVMDKDTTHINLVGWSMTNIPDNLGSMFPNLEVLELTGLGISKLPSDLNKMTELADLMIADNNISELPKNIAELDGLFFFNAANNPITSIPEEYRDANFIITVDESKLDDNSKEIVHGLHI